MLSPKEIDSIKALLLSPDSSNVILAAALLQEQAEAVQQLFLPLEIALTYSGQKDLISNLLKQHQHQLLWRDFPLYSFYNTIAEPQAQPEHRAAIRRFIRQEPHYRSYLLDDPQKAILYVDGATFISSEPEFVPAAHDFYALALAHLPEDSYLYYNYADLLRQHPPKGKPVQDYQKTIVAYYKKAYTFQQEKHILSRLARFYTHDLNDISNARRTWQYCLQEHPNYGEAWVALAELEIEVEAWSIAKKLLKRALELQAAGTWINLDQVYYLMGNIAWKGEKDTVTASQYYEKALAENRYFAAPLEALLALSLATSNHHQAIRWHQVALSMQPMNIFLLLQLAQLYHKTENYEKAAEYYREILALHPNYTPAVEGLNALDGF